MTNQQLFNEYLMYGGMPYLANLNYNKEAVNRYLLDLFNSVELKGYSKKK